MTRSYYYNNKTIIISTHKDFMGELGEEEVEAYCRYAKEYLKKLGYTDIECSDLLQTYCCDAPVTRGSNEYADIEDALESAWNRAIA